MSDSIIAYRYAKSLVDLATEKGVVEEVSEDMTFFKKVSDENRQFMKAMANPIVRHDTKLKILKKVFEGNVNPVTFSILNILTKKNRESLITSIADEFRKLYNQQKNIEVASVITVEPLTEAQRTEFKKIVAKATGNTVQLTETTDEALIGGYVLKVGDSQVDTSIRRKLNDLKLSLN
jgi:F-type H+-transporting ATPase subunit delta